MAYLLSRFRVDDFDAWKRQFDDDPLGRRGAAKGHLILRSDDDPNEFFLATQFASADAARSFLEQLRGTDLLDGIEILTPPTIAAEVESQTY